jgi:hypothetical protein
MSYALEAPSLLLAANRRAFEVRNDPASGFRPGGSLSRMFPPGGDVWYVLTGSFMTTDGAGG